MKYFLKTFGCQMNIADSERIAAAYAARGFTAAGGLDEADHIVINTCLVRQSAEERIYGLVRNLTDWKGKNEGRKIILTGCLVGLAVRDKTGRILQDLRKRLPEVDEFLPITEVGFDQAPLRTDNIHAWVPISNGCNNFCSFCVVPYTRGPEVSRPLAEVLAEGRELLAAGYREVTLLGQNVNSYGADLIDASVRRRHADPPAGGEASPAYAGIFSDKPRDPSSRTPQDDDMGIQETGGVVVAGRVVRPVMVKHLGKDRIPTLFPYLLEEVAKLDFDKIDFISSNPWDFSGELIDVIARYPNISREIHLPVQAGDDAVLKKMNRSCTRDQYLQLVADLRSRIYDLRLTTDIIVGFPGETEEQFERTVELCRRAGFAKAYLAMYSPRPRTVAQRTLADDVSYLEKKRRWQVLEDLINKPHLLSKAAPMYI